MSYIRAKKVRPEGDSEWRDIRLYPQDDSTLDSEMLDFVLGLIEQINELGEGEALVVWKEIF